MSLIINDIINHDYTISYHKDLLKQHTLQNGNSVESIGMPFRFSSRTSANIRGQAVTSGTAATAIITFNPEFTPSPGETMTLTANNLDGSTTSVTYKVVPVFSGAFGWDGSFYNVKQSFSNVEAGIFAGAQFWNQFSFSLQDSSNPITGKITIPTGGNGTKTIQQANPGEAGNLDIISNFSNGTNVPNQFSGGQDPSNEGSYKTFIGEQRC